MVYLHLGNNTIVRMSDIVGIFDLDTSTISYKTRDFLSEAEKKGQVVNVSLELPKSFVICRENEGCKIYICQLSPVTLMKRAEHISLMAE